MGERRFVCALIGLLALALLSCRILSPAPDLTWDPSPDALIIRATGDGGMEPVVAPINRIPFAQVWGDGRIIWTISQADGAREVMRGQLTQAQLTALLEEFAREGFFRWKNHYSPKDMVYDSSTTSLYVNLLEESKRVSEYHDGAPKGFYKLIGRVKSGAGAEGQPYVPVRGYLGARLLTPANDVDPSTPVWDPEALGVDLAHVAEEGLWVEGAPLAAAWEIVNRAYWHPLVVQGDQQYLLTLQMPELTGRKLSSAQ